MHNVLISGAGGGALRTISGGASLSYIAKNWVWGSPSTDDLFSIYSLAEFDDSQVADYAGKWFGLREAEFDRRASDIARGFIDDTRDIPDLRSNGLLLALLCNLYAGDRYIPRNRSEVYERCAVLLFERWDRERDIRLNVRFRAHVKYSIAHLAAWIIDSAERESGVREALIVEELAAYPRTRVFDESQDVEAEEAAQEFFNFCRTRAWVLSEVGDGVFTFSHRTFLEYFAAVHLLRTQRRMSDLWEVLRPRLLRGEWDMVGQLVVAMSDKNDQDAAEELLGLIVSEPIDPETMSARSTLLSWYLRCMGSIIIAPAPRRVLADSLVQMVCAEVDQSLDRSKLVTNVLTPFLSVAGDNLAPLSEALIARLQERLLDDDPTVKRVAAIALLYLTDFCTRDRSDVPNLRLVQKAIGEASHANLEALRNVGQLDELVALALCERGLTSVAEFCRAHSLAAAFYVRAVVQRGDSSTYVGWSLAEYAIFMLLRSAGEDDQARRDTFDQLALILEEESEDPPSIARPLEGHPGSDESFISPFRYPGAKFVLDDNVQLSMSQLLALWFCLALWREDGSTSVSEVSLGDRQWIVESLESIPTEEAAIRTAEQLSSNPEIQRVIVGRLLRQQLLRGTIRDDENYDS